MEGLVYNFALAGLHFTDQPTLPIQVTAFQCEQDEISCDYRFEIDILSRDYFNCAEMLQAFAVLSWAGQISSQIQYRRGYITQSEYVGKQAQGWAYRFTLQSPLYPLAFRQLLRVWVDTSLKDIVREVMAPKGMSPVWYWDYAEEGERFPYHVQYAKSDADLLQQLMIRQGLSWRFAHTQHGSYPYVAQQWDKWREMPPEQTLEPLAQIPIHQDYDLRTQAWHYDDYCPQSPQLSLSVNSQNKTGIYGLGTVQHFGTGQSTVLQGQVLVNARQQQEDALRQLITVQTYQRDWQAGMLATWQDKTYRVINIHHEARQNPDDTDTPLHAHLRYRATLTLIPDKHETYVSLKQLSQYDAWTKQRMPLLSAKIVGKYINYPELDIHGNYYSRLPFVDKKMKWYNTSHAQRLIQPQCNPAYTHATGWHFPLLPGNEVAVTHLYGDINRPILLGALPNPETSSVTAQHNQAQHLMHTPSGHHLSLIDNPSYLHARLSTPNHQNHLTLFTGKDQTPQLTLMSEPGNVLTHTQGDSAWQTQTTHQQQSQTYYQQIQGNYTHHNKQAKWQTKKAISLLSNHTVSLQTTMDQQLTTEKPTQLMGKRVVLQSDEKALQLSSQKNNVQVVTTKAINAQANKQASLKNVHAIKQGIVFQSPALKINAPIIQSPQPVGGAVGFTAVVAGAEEGGEIGACGGLIGAGIGGLLGSIIGATIINYESPPKDLKAFPDAKIDKKRGKRRRWRDRKGRIYEWDYQHGKVEVYDKTGKKHLGEFDPNTGEQTKPEDKSRKIDK